MAILELYSPLPLDRHRAPDTLLGIPDGPAGIAATLQYMQAWARQYSTDPYIRATVRQIFNGVPAKNATAEVSSIQAFVKNTVRYTMDPEGVESLQTPLDTLEYKHGDCDDQALLVATLLLAAGYKPRFVVFAFDGPGEFAHVYTEVLLGRHWYGLETTEGDKPMGWRPETDFPTMVRHI